MNAIQMKRKCNNVIAKYDPKYSECGSVDIKRIKIHANASINLGTETQAVRCCQNEVEDSKSISNQNGLVCRQRISSTAIQDIFKKHKVAMEFYQVAISKFESISDDLRALPDIFHKQTVAMEFSGVSLLKFQSVSDDLINIIEENERCDALQQHPNSNKVKSYQEQNLTMKTKIIYDQNSSSNFEVIDLDSDEEDCKWISFGNNAELITNSRDLLESPDISTNSRLKSSCENYKDLQKKEGNRSLNITWLPCPLCLCSPVEHKNLVNRCGLKKIEDQRFPITPLVPKVTSEKRIYVQNSSITHTDDSQQISKRVKGHSILSTDNSQIVEDGPSLKKYSRKVKIIVPTVKKMIEDLPSNSRRSNNY